MAKKSYIRLRSYKVDPFGNTGQAMGHTKKWLTDTKQTDIREYETTVIDGIDGLASVVAQFICPWQPPSQPLNDYCWYLKFFSCHTVSLLGLSLITITNWVKNLYPGSWVPANKISLVCKNRVGVRRNLTSFRILALDLSLIEILSFNILA